MSAKYHSIVSWTCPFAHRSIIARSLFGVEDQVSQTEVSPIRLENKWAFQDKEQYHTPAKDTLYPEVTFLSEIYDQTAPENWDKVNSVPLILDASTKKSVTNNSAESVWLFAKLPGAKLPEGFELGSSWDSDATKEILHKYLDPVTHSFKAPVAKTQEEYDEIVAGVRKCYDEFEAHLGKHKFSAGDKPSGVDILLWTFYVRWDTVMSSFARIYISHRIQYPNITRWIRAVAAMDGGKVGKSFKQQAADVGNSEGVHGIPIFPHKEQVIAAAHSNWEFSDK